MSQKAITSEAFEKIHQVVLYYISKNMAPLFQSGNYGAINTTDTPTMGYHVIKFVSKDYTLQDDTTFDVKRSSSFEVVLKAQFIRCMTERTKWYWD